MIGTLAVLALAGNCVSAFRSSKFARTVAITSATISLLAPIISVIAINFAAAWATPVFLPSTFRRVLIGVTPNAGIWLALGGGLMSVIAAIDKSPVFLDNTRRAASRFIKGDRTVIAVLLALVGSVLYLVSRYEPWLTLRIAATDNGSAHWPIPGFALPVVGIISIFEIIAIATCAIWQITRPTLGTATCMTIVGFAPLFYGTIGMCLRLAPSQLHITIPRGLAQSLAQWSPSAERLSNGYVNLPQLSHDLRTQIDIGVGSTLSAAAGICVTLAGLVLIYTHNKEEGLQ